MRDDFCNMEWSNNSLGDDICDLECMTPDCNYDTDPAFVEEGDYPSDYFEQFSDCG